MLEACGSGDSLEDRMSYSYHRPRRPLTVGRATRLARIRLSSNSFGEFTSLCFHDRPVFMNFVFFILISFSIIFMYLLPFESQDAC